MNFSILYNIFIKHTYFTNDTCSCILLTPDAATAKAIRNHQWIFKQLSDNHWIIAGDINHKTLYPDDKETIKLNITIKDVNFLYYTDSTGFSNQEWPVIDFGTPAEDTIHICIPGDIRHAVRVNNPAISGAISFTVTEKGIERAASSAFNLSVCFDACSVYWEYILIPRRQEINGIFFLSEDEDRISFADAVPYKVANHDAFSIKSVNPVRLSEHYPYTLRLYEKRTYGKKLVCNNVDFPAPGRFLSRQNNILHYVYF